MSTESANTTATAPRPGKNAKSAKNGKDSRTEAILRERLRALAENAGRSMTGLALSWLAAQPTVASVLVGATTAEQVAANAAALEELPAELLTDIAKAAGEPQG